MFKYLLELIVFVCGAALMVMELVVSRILAPFLGTSMYVWTNVIGVILASLSLGYYLGGRYSDKNPSEKFLARIIFISAIAIIITTIINIPILYLIQKCFSDARIGGLIATLVLFAIPSTLLGMVSPYAAKLKISNLEKSGATVGNLYALSTLGSIIGTFGAGFFLIPNMGSQKILFLISMILIVLTILFDIKKLSRTHIFILFFLAFCIYQNNISEGILQSINLKDFDTEYSRVWIYDTVDKNSNSLARYMLINNEESSAKFLQNDDLVFDYFKFFRLAKHFNPQIKNSLMLGGAGYSYPMDYLKRYPNESMDVIEIDPKVTQLAKTYFGLTDMPNLTTYYQDARIFLNKSNKKYDVIWGDIFRGRAIPFQLTTKEAVGKLYNALNENGLVMYNIGASIDGDNGRFLRAEYKTFKEIFPQVYLFPIQYNDPTKIQNIVLVALKSNKTPQFTSDNEEYNKYLGLVWKNQVPLDMPILTDDYAPVEYYSSGI